MSFSNTYDTTNPGSGVANREDLGSMVHRMAPEQTPFYSMIDMTKATNPYHEWLVDTLDDPKADGLSEGADITAYDDVFEGAARIGNYIQRFPRSFRVSNIQQASNSGGVVNIAEAETKAMILVKRDVEFAICSANDRSAENGAGQNYKLRGFLDFIDSAGPSDVPENYRTPAGSIHSSGTFTEDSLKAILTSISRQNGGTNNLTLITDTALRSLISKTFTNISGETNQVYRSVNFNGLDKKISSAVHTYESDHGLVTLVNANPDCMPDKVNKDTGYVINPDYCCCAELIPLQSHRVDNLGGGERGYVEHVLTFVVKNPLAHGKITAIS